MAVTASGWWSWCVALGLLGACAASPDLSAQIYSWNNVAGGVYQGAGNWSPAGPPVAGAIARFNLANTYTVNFNANAGTGRLELLQGDVTFDLGGFNYQLTSNVNNVLGNASGGNATLRLRNGGISIGGLPIASTAGSYGHLSIESGATVSMPSSLSIGGSGTGQLSVLQGAQLTSGQVKIGAGVGGTGTALISGDNSTWSVNNFLFALGDDGQGTVQVLAGGKINAQGLSLGQQDTGLGTLHVAGNGSQVNLSGTLFVGLGGEGELSLAQGGKVTAAQMYVGEFDGSRGVIDVSGAGSTLTINGAAFLGSFNGYLVDQAQLNVLSQGTVDLKGTTNLASDAVIQVHGGTLKLANLTMDNGAQIHWTAGTIEFANAGTVSDGVLDVLLGGGNSIASGQTLKANSGTLALDRMLSVGGTISGGDVAVNESLAIQAFGKVTASGQMQIASGTSVQVAGLGTLGVGFQLNNDGLIVLDGPLAKIDGYLANNFGTLQGTGRISSGMSNGTGGTVRALAGEHLIVQTASSNLGNIELSGGTLEFTHALSNLANGTISGRGEFRGGTSNPGSWGLSNQGVLMFSGGTTDIRGDVNNYGTGRIVTAGGAITTFYDDVVHNGAEIRTNLGARTVFFGAQTGAGSFTGGGVVEYNGDLRPGNSPATVYYAGDVQLNSTAQLYFELGGIFDGEYDRLSITGDVWLDGNLFVELIDGFNPLNGQSFLLVEKRSPGLIAGEFYDVAEGALLSFAGQQFVASYVGGDGNDFTLTAIPEPTGGWLLVAALSLLTFHRKPRSHRAR